MAEFKQLQLNKKEELQKPDQFNDVFNVLETAKTVTAPDFDLNPKGGNITDGGEHPKRTIILTAAGGWPSTTTGASAVTKVEYGTNDVDLQHIDFDQTTQEYAQWTVVMPDSYDGGVIKFRTIWTAAAGSGGVAWDLQGRSFANDEAIDQAWGTVQTVTDTLIATGDVHITDESADITLAGTPEGGELVQFRLSRQTGHTSDTLTADARLIAVKIEYGIESYGD